MITVGYFTEHIKLIIREGMQDKKPTICMLMRLDHYYQNWIKNYDLKYTIGSYCDRNLSDKKHWDRKIFNHPKIYKIQTKYTHVLHTFLVNVIFQSFHRSKNVMKPYKIAKHFLGW